MLIIKQNIETNRKLKIKLYDYLVTFIYKYLKRCFEKQVDLHSTSETRPKLYPDFQRVLLKIPKWSSNTLEKEYYKFLKWVKKRNESRNDIQDVKQLGVMLKDIIKLSTEIIINKSDVYVNALLQDYKFPSLQQFFYKCLKKIARIIYENPKSLYTIKTELFIEQIDNVLNSMLPSKEIETVLQFIDEDEGGPINKGLEVKFNFENDSNESTDLEKRSSEIANLIIDKQSSEPSLHYISSNELNSELESIIQQSVGNKETEDGIKYINIPRINRPRYKSKIDEIDEYFFNE
jgi:hypothetical protein